MFRNAVFRRTADCLHLLNRRIPLDDLFRNLQAVQMCIRDRETTELFTHMPLAEFPAKEQERLMAGIWFPTMAEIFSYLESYSS